MSERSQHTALAHAFKYALDGILYAMRSQRNLKIELAVAVLALIANTVLRLTPIEWAVILVLIGLVLVFELLNTALETLVDLVTSDIHPLAKIAKDLGAGMVLLLALVSVIAGLIIYANALIRLAG
ncbi:MAG: diacylglycerol kinase family protein [Coriobacteriales bacterium]|nr:diacylglycerol kinase family protein [Coriobacteriales bacterium]